jgi:MoxR-like ATPase
VKEMIFPVFRHRIILNYEALAEWITTDFVIDKILEKVKVC